MEDLWKLTSCPDKLQKSFKVDFSVLHASVESLQKSKLSLANIRHEMLVDLGWTLNPIPELLV